MGLLILGGGMGRRITYFFIRHCTENPTLDERTMAYYNETIETSVKRIQPLISYFHKDPRTDKFGGTSLTGVQPYMGTAIPNLHGSVVFTDLAQKGESRPSVKGVLAYTKASTDGKHTDFHVIETDYGTQAAYYMSLGTNLDQTRLYLGVYGSMKVTDFNKGTILKLSLKTIYTCSLIIQGIPFVLKRTSSPKSLYCIVTHYK